CSKRRVQVAAPLEAAGRFLPACLQQERLAKQAPGERLRPHRLPLLGQRQHVPRVLLDAVEEAVAVEVVLADAVVDVEDAGGRGVGVALKALELELEAALPVAAEVRDDCERLLGGGEIVVAADTPCEVARPLAEGLGAVEVAALPCL